jgi:hypothetical protein
MSELALIVIVLAAPIVAAGAAWLILGRFKQPSLDQPLDLVQLWRRGLGLVVTPRQVLKAALLCMPLAFYSTIGLGIGLVWYALAGFVVWKIVSWHSTMPPSTQSVLAELETAASTLANSRSAVEHLLQLVTLKAQELEAKSAEKLALEKVITEKMKGVCRVSVAYRRKKGSPRSRREALSATRWPSHYRHSDRQHNREHRCDADLDASCQSREEGADAAAPKDYDVLHRA